jgi:1-acyl-sn-glycerol-3-phosphate acyltransferase
LIRSTTDRAWRTFFTGSAFLLFFLGGLLLSYLVLPVARFGRGTRAEKARRCRRIVGSAWVLFHDYMRVTRLLRYDARATALRLPAGPFVMVANHPTLVDVTALVATTPDIAIVAKRAMFRSPLVGPLLRACDHIEAGEGGLFAGAVVAEQALRRLRAGTPVLIFPEGTRSPASGVGELRLGAFQIAARSGVPIVPFLITCDPPTLMRGQSWYAIPERTAVMTVRQLPVLDPGCGAAVLARSLRDTYRQRLGCAPATAQETTPVASLAHAGP